MADDEEDLGAPVAELSRLVEEPRLGFLERVRGAIERRRLGSDMTGLFWNGVALVVVEFLSMVATLLGSGASTPAKDEPTDREPPTA